MDSIRYCHYLFQSSLSKLPSHYLGRYIWKKYWIFHLFFTLIFGSKRSTEYFRFEKDNPYLIYVQSHSHISCLRFHLPSYWVVKLFPVCISNILRTSTNLQTYLKICSYWEKLLKLGVSSTSNHNHRISLLIPLRIKFREQERLHHELWLHL